jgi:predicted ester cyclase
MASQEQRNKQLYLQYLSELNGKAKPRHILEKYVANEKLIEHVLFFEKMFPEYCVEIHEIIAEGDRLFVRAEFIGSHIGEIEGIPSTNQEVTTPFALGYRYKDGKITEFWAIANEVELFEQLGISRDDVNVSKD